MHRAAALTRPAPDTTPKEGAMLNQSTPIPEKPESLRWLQPSHWQQFYRLALAMAAEESWDGSADMWRGRFLMGDILRVLDEQDRARVAAVELASGTRPMRLCPRCLLESPMGKAASVCDQCVKAIKRLRSKMKPSKRRAVLDRDDWQCRECGGTEELDVDHIVPLVAGGTNALANLQILCSPCNGAKGSRP